MASDASNLELDGKLGPAMAALNERQRKFVLACVRDGLNATRAAAAAGYSGDGETLKATGYRLNHDDRIQAALHEEGAKRLRGAAGLAVTQLVNLLDHEDPDIQLKSAKTILDRSGLPAVSKTEVAVSYQPPQQQLIQEIIAMANALDLDARELLSKVGVTLDADFQVVEVGQIEALPAPETPSTEKLESF